MWNQTNVNAKLTTHFHKVQTKTKSKNIIKIQLHRIEPDYKQTKQKRPNWTVVWSFQK